MLAATHACIFRQHALSSNNGKVPHRIGRSFLIDDDVNTTQGRASSHRIDQAALNEILAMNEQLDYEDRYADMDDASVGGESAASVAVCGPSRKPRFRDTVSCSDIYHLFCVMPLFLLVYSGVGEICGLLAGQCK